MVNLTADVQRTVVLSIAYLKQILDIDGPIVCTIGSLILRPAGVVRMAVIGAS
jgi:hypothetical protein